MRFFIIVVACAVATAEICQRGSDCPDNECCMVTPDGAICQPMAKFGADCVYMSGTFLLGKPEDPVPQCPCRWGMHCVLHDPTKYGVDGATGVCQPRPILS